MNSIQKKRKFNQIVKDIKNIKIQGARNIAKAALKAYYLFPSKSSKKKLLSLRPTEPLLSNILDLAEKNDSKKILDYFDNSQNKINKEVYKLIKNNDIIFTHCHSNTVIEALIYTRKKGKKFQIYNTETRPLYQGRKTAKELKNAGISVTLFVDSAIGIALSKEQKTKKVDKIFLGADALLDKGIINKIGSETIAILAKKNKIPVYILANSLKYSNKKIKLEKRNWKEVWSSYKKSINLKILNPAFEFVPKKYISGIITEFGLRNYRNFLKKVKN